LIEMHTTKCSARLSVFPIEPLAGLYRWMARVTACVVGEDLAGYRGLVSGFRV